MTIVLPIVFMATIVGLFARRLDRKTWAFLIFWILLVIAFQYFRKEKSVELPQPHALLPYKTKSVG